MKFLPDDKFEVDFMDSGLDTSQHPERIDQSKTPNCNNVRLTDHGLSTDLDNVALGVAYTGVDKPILAIEEFQRKGGAKEYLLRIRNTGWDAWDGAAWTTLSGATLGSAGYRPYIARTKDRILMANGFDRIMSWDGSLGTPVAALSADAPICRYIAPFANRLIATYVDHDGYMDPYGLAWSADGIITNFTDVLLGAGLVSLEPDGRRAQADFFTGLSALETMLVLYRQSSIQVGVRTGIAIAPFQFYTQVEELGTLSPYSVATVGKKIGDLFVGHDLNVYLYDGNNPIPVGEQITKTLQAVVTDPEALVGRIDWKNREYWLANITTGDAWVLSLRELFNSKKIIWHHRTLPANTNALGFGYASGGPDDPIVDTVNLVVDTVGSLVDRYDVGTIAKRYTLFGDTLGAVSALDGTVFTANGYWYSKPMAQTDMEATVDQIYFRYLCRTAAQVKVGLSFDGGTTVVTERIVNVAVGSGSFSTWHDITGRAPQVKITIVSGDLTISDFKAVARARGRITSTA